MARKPAPPPPPPPPPPSSMSALGTPENLEGVPGTVGGLKQFISAACLLSNVPGLFDSRYL
ncbi:hypothetical protein ETB97_000468, partial [Aspergillus alliaceus]